MNKKLVALFLLLAPAWWLAGPTDDAAAIGRGGGGGGRGGGGGGARPAPAARPAAPRPTPSVPRPNPQPAHRPTAPAGRPTPKVDGNRPITLPANVQRPAQLPKVDRPVTLPKTGGGKIDLPKGKIDLPKGKIDVPKVDWRPKDGGGIAGKGDRLPNFPGAGIDNKLPNRPSAGDLDKWMNLPKDGGANLRPNRPNFSAEQKNQFQQNWNKALVNRPTNINTINNLKNYQGQANFIRNNVQVNVNNNNWLNRNWWNGHANFGPHWHYHNWGNRPWNYWWRPTTWLACTAWMPFAWGQPMYYDYGTTVVYRDDYVYVNDQQIATAPEYAAQAIALADVTPPPEDKQIEWLPLGTFALAASVEDKEATKLLQLALSKDGLISGTYFDTTTEKTFPVQGKVDPSTQRTAIRMDDASTDIVMEVGIYNLTQQQTPVLLHFGTLRTQTWFLVRLEAPEQKEE